LGRRGFVAPWILFQDLVIVLQAMAQLGDKDGAILELKSVIQRYPRSVEATTARDQLRKLGVVSAKPSAARR